MPEPMPPADASNPLATLLASLRRTGLLSPEALAEVEARPDAQGTDPRPLGRHLFQQGLVTRYQLNQLATGRDDDLIVGPYLLIEKIAEGGGGQVFKARHRVMNRTVALKRIRPEKLGNPELMARFFREAQVAAQLDHPNVVRAFDAGQVGATCFLAMEFVDGMDLTKFVTEAGSLSTTAAIDTIRQAAMGLQHAHERGLVHRDIKPSNLLVSPIVRPTPESPPAAGVNAVVKILDLGLARWQSSDDGAGDKGMGSPHFVAPEQAKNAQTADIRSDLYSLGATFFYLLTGQPPFQGATASEVLVAHRDRPVPRIQSIRAGIPVAVGDLITKLLSKSPTERFQTPSELVAALTTLAASLSAERPTVAPPTKPPAPVKPASSAFDFSDEHTPLKVVPKALGDFDSPDDSDVPLYRKPPTKKKIGKHWLVIGALLHVSAAALIVMLIAGVFRSKPTEPEPKPLVKAPSPPVEKVTPPPPPIDDKPPPPVVAVEPKVPNKATKAVVEFTKGRPPLNEEPLYLVNTVRRKVPKIAYPGQPPVMKQLGGSPGSAAVVYGTVGPALLVAGPEVGLFDPVRGREVSKLPGSQGMTNVIVHPSGLFAAGLIDGKLYQACLDPPEKPRPMVNDPGGHTALAYSPNGNYVLTAGSDGIARLWDLSIEQTIRVLRVGDPITSVAIHANGWLAILGTTLGNIGFYDLESQTILTSGPIHKGSVTALACVPGGALVLSAGEDGKLAQWDALRGRQKPGMYDLRGPVEALIAVTGDIAVAGTRGGQFWTVHLAPQGKCYHYGGNDADGEFRGFAVAVDGTSIIASFSKSGLGRLDLAGGQASGPTP